jgi:hypothetical protein
MGSVTLFNATRMQAIEDGTVTSGLVDGQGHLILSHHDGSTVDAGKVTAENLADASDSVPGIVRLATDAETVAGTDDDTAVTPQDLSAWATANRASTSEAEAGANATKLITPKTLFDVRASNTETYSGVIDPAWGGSGPTCPVILDGSQTDSGTKNTTYDFLDSKIQPGVKVIVSRIGDSASGKYFIDRAFPAFSPFPKQIPIVLQGTWGLYSNFNDTSEAYGTPKYQIDNKTGVDAGYIYASMSRYGIVRVEGLIQNSVSNPGLQSVIAYLPPGMWPSTERQFVVINGSTTASVLVRTDGAILFMGTTGANIYYSLSAIRFRAKSAVDLGLATFVDITSQLKPGMAAYTGTYYTGGPTLHTPGYTIDPDNIVILEGAVVATSAYTNGNTFAILSDMPFVYPNPCHQIGYAPSVTVGALRYGNTKDLNFTFDLPVGKYAMLDQMSLVDPNSPTVKTVTANGTNNWFGYGGGWRAPSYAVTPDGQVYLFGLWNNGAIGSAMLQVGRRMRPRYQTMLSAICFSGVGRVDVKATDGTITPTTGSNAWYSLDGVDYSIYLVPPIYL